MTSPDESQQPVETRVAASGTGAIAIGGDALCSIFDSPGASITVVNPATEPWQAPSWPALIGLLPDRAEFYQDRPQAGEIANALADGGTAVLGLVITGTGGVGKTQLAAAYAHTVWERAVTGPRTDGDGPEPVEVLVWVSATSAQAITSAYAEAARKLVDGGLRGVDAETAARAFLGWLRTSGRRWLVVLDDVPRPAELNVLWPPQVPTGRTLVTTRSRDAAWSTDTRRLLQIGVFKPLESRAYLWRALGRPGRSLEDSDTDLGRLTDALGHLPLALAQASAYLVDTGRTIDQYLNLLDGRAKTLTQLVPPIDGLPDKQTRTVAALWDISIELADAHRPVGLARPLLELASVLNSDGIPAAVLTSEATRGYLARRRPGRSAGEPQTGEAVDEVDAEDAEDALTVLHRLNLVNRLTGRQTTVVQAHQLLQRAVRESSPGRPPAPDPVPAAADALLEVWLQTGQERDSGDRLRAGAAALRENDTQNVLWRPGMHQVLVIYGQSLGQAGAVRAAVEYFSDLTEDAKHQLGADDPYTLVARGDLAYWYGEAGDAGGAVGAYQQLLADRLRVLGPDHPHTLITRSNLAVRRGELEDTSGALEEYERLLPDLIRLLGPLHPDALTARHNLARLRGQSGDLAGAVVAYERLVPDLITVLGPEHPNTLSTQGSLAHWRAASGDPAGAVEAYRQVVADTTRALGADHPNTLTTRGELAQCLHAAGEPAESVAGTFERLLVDMERVLGPSHPATFTTQLELANAQGLAGAPAAAVDHDLERLVADMERALGLEQPAVLTARVTHAHWHGMAGDPAGAVALLEEILDHLRDARRQDDGAEHPDALDIHELIAFWQKQTAEPASTADELERLLAVQLAAMGPDHPDILALRHRIAHCHEHSGDAAATATAFTAFVDAQVRILGSDHPDTLRSRHTLAHWLGAAGDAAGAAQAYEQLLADHLRLLPPDHHDVLAVRQGLAGWRAEASGDATTATADFETLLPDVLRVLGPDHPLTEATRLSLADWQAKAGSPVDLDLIAEFLRQNPHARVMVGAGGARLYGVPAPSKRTTPSGVFARIHSWRRGLRRQRRGERPS